jgi:choline kinase
MENPLDDVETLKIDNDGFLTEIGSKPKSLSEVEGQYVGLTKVSKKFFSNLIDEYNNLNSEEKRNIHLTRFINHLINKGYKIKAVKVHGGWIEIDSIQDLERYSSSTYIRQRLGIN